MAKKLFSCLIFMIMPVLALAQDLKVNNRQIDEGQALNLFQDDLDAGRINFSFSAKGLKKSEISFDQGRNWEEMKEEGDNFIFSYRPNSDETIRPEMLLSYEGSNIQTYRPNIRIYYRRVKPEEEVIQLLDKMQLYYEQENKDRFIGLFASSYPDRVKFDEAIQNDFYNYNNIRLRYRVDRKIFDEDYEGAIWDVYWERKGDSRAGVSFSDNAAISMRIIKDGSNWLISGMRSNSIFGSSLLDTSTTSTSKPDLSISTSNITLTKQANGSPIAITISTSVNNIGAAAANNVKIKYYKKVTASTCGGVDADFVEISTNQISSIGANSSGTATNIVYTQAPACYGTTTVTIKVMVNYDNSIVESDAGNDTNNSATNSVTSTYVP